MKRFVGIVNVEPDAAALMNEAAQKISELREERDTLRRALADIMDTYPTYIKNATPALAVAANIALGRKAHS